MIIKKQLKHCVKEVDRWVPKTFSCPYECLLIKGNFKTWSILQDKKYFHTEKLFQTYRQALVRETGTISLIDI